MYPNFFADAWVGHSCSAILESMQRCGAEVSLTVLAKAKDVHAPYVRSVVPRRLARFIDPKIVDPTRLVGRRFARIVNEGDIAYVWLGVDADICEKLRSRGAFVVREMINCTQKRRRVELRRAYELLGWPDGSGITDREISDEAASLNACDAVFCPSPQVRESVIDGGVDSESCLSGTYGWSDRRIRSTPDETRRTTDEITVLFVGTLDVRKGVPWLLEAWSRAKVRGRLLLAGPVSAEIATGCQDGLSRSNVQCLGHVKDVASVYGAADIFVLPTWEEGAPLVTLEAMASGLPCITTAMGTAGAVTDQEGVLVDPGDVDALAEAIARLAADPELRRELGGNARACAQEYTWDKVGRRRFERLVAKRDRVQSIRARGRERASLYGRLSSSGR
jgi:glycosyltransferase involved in cell wall biosynthesis